MKHHLEKEFNEQLNKQEFLLKFRGDNELILIGAPSGQLKSRIGVAIVGLALVSFCLISGGNAGKNTTLMIGGSLLGLILASTPFISFYSRKFYRVLISNRIKQISITSGVSSPDKRLDFANIDHLILKHLQIDDLVSGTETANNISYMHTFMAVSGTKQVELFTLLSSDEEFKKFVEKFGLFLSSFIDKELKIIVA